MGVERAMDDSTFERLTGELERLLGIDLHAYKQQQMRRRVTTFVSNHTGDDVDAFIRRIAVEKDLLQAVRDMLTINVTDFFRDPVQWTQLERSIMPGLLANHRPLRIWSAGCSYGHEPLSLAILLDRLDHLAQARILATDFDHRALARAKSGGPYRPDELRGLSPADSAKWFSQEDGQFTASPALRAGIRFRELNLLRDPFDREFDLVLCRNVLIYFESHVKAALVRRFRESLRPGGVLFIGSTEALIANEGDGFERLGGNFYRRVA